MTFIHQDACLGDLSRSRSAMACNISLETHPMSAPECGVRQQIPGGGPMGRRRFGAALDTFVLVLLLSGQSVQAQGSSACEGLRQAVIRQQPSYSVMNVNKARELIEERVTLPSGLYGEPGCPPGTQRYFQKPVKDPKSPDFMPAVRDWGKCAQSYVDGSGRGLRDTPHLQYLVCEAQVWSAELGGGAPANAPGSVQPVPSNPASPPPQSSANRQQTGVGQAPSSSGTNLPPEVAQSLQITAQRQQTVDQARAGKPKRHVVAREAHNCLKPQTGGGVINECPYAVEYSYCVLMPKPGSWAESFTCGKSMGSWQVGPGPNARSIMHTAGETTYWFACRYGETLGKPDGVSPVDLEYQAGRGILGRCAEWGTGGGAALAQARNMSTPAPQQSSNAAARTVTPPAAPSTATSPQSAFVPGTCTRADRGTNKQIRQYQNGPPEYCACIPSAAYDAKRCSCLKNPRGAGC